MSRPAFVGLALPDMPALQLVHWPADRSNTFSSPVVSGGLVWVGTSVAHQHINGQEYHSVLKCFRIADGKRNDAGAAPTGSRYNEVNQMLHAPSADVAFRERRRCRA